MNRFSKSLTKAILALMLFYLIFPSEAYAYIDPGSGSMVIQVVIAALLGFLLAVKTFWNRIKTAVKKLFFRKCGNADE